MRNVLVLLALLAPLSVSAEPDPSRGATLFVDYCAACHGVSATGDGPMAPILSVQPSDLTTLAQVNDGTFPAERVVRHVDGQIEVLPHGGPMPVFATILAGPAGVIVTDDGIEVVTSAAIVDIAAWLARVQKGN
jgi:mono/diheme cytochrome c family protein